jgi:hypothetical protein
MSPQRNDGPNNNFYLHLESSLETILSKWENQCMKEIVEKKPQYLRAVKRPSKPYFRLDLSI